MGAKHSFRSPGGGGYPFLYAPRLLPGCSPAAPRLLLSSSIDANFQAIGQNRAKVRFYLLALVFSRDFRRPKTAKVNIYFSFVGCRASVVALHLGRRWCPLGAGGAGFDGLPWFSGCFPSLSPCLLSLCCFCFGVLLANMALFSVLRGFIWVYRLLVWVCSFCVLCVACRAFVCVSG